MGKRSNFERVERDFYPTPVEAVVPLLPHLAPRTLYAEPCAGNGALIDALAAYGHTCCFASDIEPRADGIHERDARTVNCGPDLYITNPPWDRKILHPIIENLCRQAPTWLLFDADWMHTRQSAAFMPMLHKVVSIGRVKWIADSPFTGKDNCCWYLFDASAPACTQFIGRQAA